MIKMNRSKKKKRKHVFVIFLAVLAFLAIALLIIVKLFTVQTVEVEGNELYTNDQIQEWVLNDDYSWNSLYVYLKYRFFDTQEVPFIDTMEVGIKSPHTIVITVYEKGLLGYLTLDSIGQNVYFDKDGFVVETSSEVIDGIPQITGLTCDKVVLYEKLDFGDASVLKTLLNVTQSLKKYSLVPDAIQYAENGTITLTYGTVTVILGQAEELTEKIIRLQKIMPSIKEMTGTLHMEDWSEETTDITFEKAE